MDQPRFSQELAVSYAAGIVAWFGREISHLFASVVSGAWHLTFADVASVANAFINVGMAITTTFAAVSVIVKSWKWLKTTYFDKKPPAPGAPGAVGTE
jgi:hypothetical protein